MSATVRIDEVEFTSGTDFAELCRSLLSGRRAVGGMPGDELPLDWVERAYERLAGTPYHDRFAAGLAECMTAPEPFVRSQALTFFELHPREPGAERAVALAAGDRKGFRGVADPRQPSIDLEWRLLRTVGARVIAGDAAAADVARKEAQSPGQPEPLIAALATVDPDWVAAHAERIVHARPATALPILVNLEKTPRIDLAALGERIARDAARDPDFRERIERMLDDAEAKRRILAALP